MGQQVDQLRVGMHRSRVQKNTTQYSFGNLYFGSPTREIHNMQENDLALAEYTRMQLVLFQTLPLV